MAIQCSRSAVPLEMLLFMKMGRPKIFPNGDLMTMSSLHLKTGMDIADPTNYVDSRLYHYFVLGGTFATENGIRIGDIGMVEDLTNGFKFFAIMTR